MVLTSRPYCLPSTWPGSSVPGSMLVFSVFMSTALSIGKAAWRLTMSPTTPGWGMKAMSGVSLAWIFCMISWLMLSTFCHLTVIPSALASLVSTSFRPSCTGWSMLLQIVTVLLSPPLPPLPHAARTDAAAIAPTASSEVRARLGNRIIYSSKENLFLDTCPIVELM